MDKGVLRCDFHRCLISFFGMNERSMHFNLKVISQKWIHFIIFRSKVLIFFKVSSMRGSTFFPIPDQLTNHNFFPNFFNIGQENIFYCLEFFKIHWAEKWISHFRNRVINKATYSVHSESLFQYFLKLIRYGNFFAEW